MALVTKCIVTEINQPNKYDYDTNLQSQTGLFLNLLVWDTMQMIPHQKLP